MASGQPARTTTETTGVVEDREVVEATEVVEASAPVDGVGPSSDPEASVDTAATAGSGSDSADTQARTPAGDALPVAVEPPRARKKPKQDKEPKKVYEAGGVIVLDGKVALRFTDGQNWIFPKGKLKKHESPEDAAIREAIEETGLNVVIVGDAGEFVMKSDGKKRRFVFYLMQATGKTWDWPHHEGRDTFLMDPDRVGSLVRKRYRKLWESCEARVRALALDGTVPESTVSTDSPAQV